jgi:two-component system alkaline phosphatase synthesis response regulator PhoP
MAKHILLVEDEESLQDIIKLNLELEGYGVTCVSHGGRALEVFKQRHFDLILLDVMLPEVDGFTICQTIRLENTWVPILFLTAKNTAEDRIFGLKVGGDDYLQKPFNLEELLLRVQALVKRSERISPNHVDVYTFGNCEINFNSFEIKDINGETHSLSQREIKLLKLLIDRKSEVVSRETILSTVWGYNVFPSTRTIDNFILAYRKYFESDPKNPIHFLSVRSVGYRFVE